MVTKGFQRWSAIIFGSLVMMIIVPNIVVAARPSRVNVATVTGEPAPAPTGRVVYESACASCHGNRAQGGAGPALAGHTEEQIVRQVRAPVGEMPMFSPRDVSSYGLEALVEMIEGLDAIEGADAGGHAHEANLLSKQEVSQLRHALILRSIEAGDVSGASHAAEELLDLLSGNHQMAMTKLLEDLRSNRLGLAEEVLMEMAADAPLTTGLAYEDLLLTLLSNSLRDANAVGTTHWLGHVEDSDYDDVAALSAAVRADDIEAAIELVERALPEVDAHSEDEEEHVDEDAHSEDEEEHVDEDVHSEDEEEHVDEDVHSEDEEEHVDEDADEQEPPDHDDGDAAPHGH